MTLIDPEGQEVDFESSRTGFRRIDIENGVILLNGIRMIFRGRGSAFARDGRSAIDDVQTLQVNWSRVGKKRSA